MRLSLLFNLAVITSFCISCVAAAIELPTEGRVYFERWNSNSVSLIPAKEVLVLVSRINVCDSNALLLRESSTTGIDAYVVRTDANGTFRIPSRTFNNVCTRAILLSEAFVPGYYSSSGRVMSRSSYYSGVNENDAILAPRALDTARIKELIIAFYSPFSSYSVTSEMKEQLYREMLPEIERLETNYSIEWHRECTKLKYVAGSAVSALDNKIGKVTCKPAHEPIGQTKKKEK